MLTYKYQKQKGDEAMGEKTEIKLLEGGVKETTYIHNIYIADFISKALKSPKEEK